jgi:hypothetical protein
LIGGFEVLIFFDTNGRKSRIGKPLLVLTQSSRQVNRALLLEKIASRNWLMRQGFSRNALDGLVKQGYQVPVIRGPYSPNPNKPAFDGAKYKKYKWGIGKKSTRATQSHPDL